MEGAFLELLIKSAPFMGGLIVIVIVFLKYMEKRDKVIREVCDNHNEVHARCITSIDKNTEMHGRVIEALHTTTKTGEKVKVALTDSIDVLEEMKREQKRRDAL